MSIRILTDSASDFTAAEKQELHIEVLPLTTVFPDGEYRDGVDLTPEQFFERLIEEEEIPTTSQVSPAAFQASFAGALEAGDDVVYIALSSKLSGTFQSACIARSMFTPEQQERLHLVDSLHVCIAEQLLVRTAVTLRDEGCSAADIAQSVERLKSRVKLVALLDTLEYLKKGGRISATAAVAGTLLSIKPVITVREGLVDVIGKARGSKNGHNMIVKFVEESGGIDERFPFALAYSGLSDRMLMKYWEDNKHILSTVPEKPMVTTIGSIIGTHVGPGAIALAFFAK